MRFTKPTAILAVVAALFLTLPTRCSCSGSRPPPTDALDATPEPPTGVTSYAVTWTCQRDCDLAFPFSVADTLRLELEDAGGFFAFFVGGDFRFGGQVVEESAMCFELRWSGQQVPESRLCATGPGSVLGSVVWLDTIVQRTTEWTFAGTDLARAQLLERPPKRPLLDARVAIRPERPLHLGVLTWLDHLRLAVARDALRPEHGQPRSDG